MIEWDVKLIKIKLIKIKALYSICRVIHIYVSTALFSLLIFFCVSGLLLNHLSWISDVGKISGVKAGHLPAEVIGTDHKALSAVNTVALIAPYLSNTYQLNELSSFDWDKDVNELILDYPIPAGYALVVINATTFDYYIEYQQANLLSVLNDLHKGRHSGKVWTWVIDISAVLICLFSFTGLFILFQNKKKRQFGLWLTLLGSVTPIIIYYFFIPRLSGVL